MFWEPRIFVTRRGHDAPTLLGTADCNRLSITNLQNTVASEVPGSHGVVARKPRCCEEATPGSHGVYSEATVLAGSHDDSRKPRVGSHGVLWKPHLQRGVASVASEATVFKSFIFRGFIINNPRFPGLGCRSFKRLVM